MNSTVKSGGMKELEFRGTLSRLTLVEDFVCNEAYFELYPIPNWKPMEFFSVEG